MNKILYPFFLIFLISSCVSKSVISDKGKYYSETNIMENINDGIKLRQRVRLNDDKDGLHSSWSFITISFSDYSKIKEGNIYTIKKDTSFFNVKYEFHSNRYWELKTKSISGTIKVNSISKDNIEITEKIYVIDEFDNKIKFKGTRDFKISGTMDKYPKMKRNKKMLWFIKNKG